MPSHKSPSGGEHRSHALNSSNGETNSAIDRLHVDGQVDHSVGVAPLVVVPSDQLHEGVVQGDASAHVEDGGRLAAHEVSGHHFVFSPVQNSSHVACSSLLVLGWLLQTARQIHHRDIPM